MIKIPGDNGWFQSNRGNNLGTVQQSFNLDLESNVGVVRTTRAKRLAYTGSPTNFDGQVAAMERFDGVLYVASENGSDNDIWVGGTAPFDTLVNDTSSVAIAPTATDMKAWNNGLYVTNATEIWYSTDGTAWNEVGSNVLTTGNPHLLTAKNDMLYVSNQAYKVHSVPQSSASLNTSGAQTLDLDIPGYVITVLMTGIDSIWVGVTSTKLGSPAFMFEWDGETENVPSARYEIDATGILAGCVKDGVPYIVDSNGRLLVQQGGLFTEVARFPLKRGSFKNFDNPGSGAIHPRGMTADLDEILICVANRTEDITLDTHNEFPSGVWAYSEQNGLYHKYSPSYQAIADTGTTNLTDHGQFRCDLGGPIFVFDATNDGLGAGGSANNGGRVLFGMRYYTDATTTQDGLFVDDTNDNTQKAGWYVSPRIQSSVFRDNWQRIYAALSELITAGDLVEVKYRIKDETPTYFTGTWTGTDRISTTTELTDYEQGDEITIVNGKGAGAIAHARDLTSGAGSEVVFDRDIAGITIGQTSKFRIENWKKIGKIEDLSTKGYTVGKDGHWIQVKLYLQWTGPRELYGLTVINSPSITK